MVRRLSEIVAEFILITLLLCWTELTLCTPISIIKFALNVNLQQQPAITALRLSCSLTRWYCNWIDIFLILSNLTTLNQMCDRY